MNYNNNTVPSQFYRNSIVPNSYAGNMNMINNNTLLKGKPVSSLEEARATSIDFDGSIFFFPDLANKRIYTKQINMDGTATMQCYELSQLPVEQSSNVNNFITREEFNNALQELSTKINSLNSNNSSTTTKEVTKYEF